MGKKKLRQVESYMSDKAKVKYKQLGQRFLFNISSKKKISIQ